MGTLIGWLLRRLRPPGGWTILLLLLIAVLSPVAALAETDWELDMAALVLIALLAASFGLGLALTKWTSTQGFAVGSAGGLIATAALVGRLVPSVTVLWSEIPHALAWHRSLHAGEITWPMPGLSTLLEMGQRGRDIGLRLWWWREAFVAGEPAQDPLILNGILGLLIWASVFFAVWQIYRRRAVWVGLLPSGVFAAGLAFSGSPMAVFYLICYLLSTLCLAAACPLWAQTERWDRKGTDYPGDLRLELTLAFSPWLLLIALLAALFPVIRPGQISDAFWLMADEPWSRLVAFGERVVGPLEGTLPGTRSGMGGAMPNAHLLGAAPELSEATAFRVETSDPPPPAPEPEESTTTSPRRYWRGASYDLYTGRGWESSPLQSQPLPPGSRLAQQHDRVLMENQSEASYLAQHFFLMPAQAKTLYAANAPFRIDKPAKAWWRSEDDLAWLTSDVREYTVFSYTPQPTVADLRTWRARLPGVLGERYLALPEALPQRVADLTDQIVAGATTDWERAHRLESFLRTYPYNLDLPEPPKNRDMVDYFLFELQEGYCDYYASAMVVMARAADLPARLATGYAQGTYEPDSNQWIVAGKDAHSWAEIYFEGIGWVEFEPTAGQPSLMRPGGEFLAAAPAPPLPERSIRSPRVIWAELFGPGIVLLASLLAFLWFRSHSPDSLTSQAVIRDRYARLTRWGTRLGVPLSDGQTPQEFGQALTDALQTRGRKARWKRLQRSAEQALPQVRALTEAFTQAQYDSKPIPDQQGRQIRELWRRLQSHLTWLWLGR